MRGERAISVVVVLATLLPVCVVSESYCRDEKGNEVDWWFIYKPPESNEFAYADPFTNLTSLRKIVSPLASTINEELAALTLFTTRHYSALERTVVPTLLSMVRMHLEGNHEEYTYLGWLLYNDEFVAHEERDGFMVQRKNTHLDKGHAKGIVGFDEHGGYWIVHSIPFFPAPPAAYGSHHTHIWDIEDNEFAAGNVLPFSADASGHSLLCVSFHASQAEAVADLVARQNPMVYEQHVGEALLRNGFSVFAGDIAAKRTPTSKPEFDSALMLDRGIRAVGISSFADIDHPRPDTRLLWDHLIPSTLQYKYNDANTEFVGLWVQTFTDVNEVVGGPEIHGKSCLPSGGASAAASAGGPSAGTPTANGTVAPLDSQCEVTNLFGTGLYYDIINIEKFGIANFRHFWQHQVDHSKWAVEANGQWVCVGTLDRVTAEATRAGGALCINAPPLARTLQDNIVDFACFGAADCCPTTDIDLKELHRLQEKGEVGPPAAASTWSMGTDWARRQPCWGTWRGSPRAPDIVSAGSPCTCSEPTKGKCVCPPCSCFRPRVAYTEGQRKVRQKLWQEQRRRALQWLARHAPCPSGTARAVPAGYPQPPNTHAEASPHEGECVALTEGALAPPHTAAVVVSTCSEVGDAATCRIASQLEENCIWCQSTTAAPSACVARSRSVAWVASGFMCEGIVGGGGGGGGGGVPSGAANGTVATRMEGEGRDSGDEGKPVPSMKDKERAEKLWSMLEAGAWLSGALLILYFSELFRVLRLSQLIAHPWWEACIILFVFNCLLVAYFAIWVARVKKQKYMDYAPRLIYVLTVSGLLCGLCFIVALWPVYGIGAPIILAVLFMSFITLPELLPFLP